MLCLSQAQGLISISGGAIYEDDLVYAGHIRLDTAGTAYPGWLMAETKRHTPGLAEVTDSEAQALGLLVARLSRALKACEGAEHIYSFVLGDHIPHLHIHVVRKWLNDDVTYFIQDMCPDPQPRLWQQYGKLSIYVPAQECILALKLMVFREKDRNDVTALLQALHVTTREQAQAIVDRFIPDKRWQEEYLLDTTLDELF